MATTSRVETQRLLAPIVATRAPVLAPAVLVCFAFFVLVAPPLLGMPEPRVVYIINVSLLAVATILTVQLACRRVSLERIQVASAAMMWLPFSATLVGLVGCKDAIWAPLLILQIIVGGVILDTRIVIATLAVAVAGSIAAIASSDTPYVGVYVAMFVAAAMLALLSHAAMVHALVNEARTRNELELQLAERARLQAGLLHAQRMEAIGTLAAGVAHDMNNVLASITNFATVLAEDLPTPAPELERITAQAERGASLTRGLLAFARGSQYRKRVVRLAEVTREIIELLSRTLPKTVTIRDEIAVGDACVEADPSHLGQVLINLGTNAADAMNGTGTLTFIAEARDGQARLSVRDTGKGMDEATRTRVFEPFFTTKALGRGTGLGLSTAWGIVRDHGGTIEVESLPGAGATFTVLLPITTAPPTVKPTRATTDPVASAPTVLVIDDEATIRESVKRVLGRIGVKVELAGDGAAGLATFSAGKFDLVILDVGMPIMGGVECFRRIRATSDIPILIATGYAPDDELAELIASGASMIEKPYSPDDLRREVARLLEQPRGGTQHVAG